MTISEFLDDLTARDIHVWADAGELRCNAPAGILTPEIRGQLQERKQEILDFLVGPAPLSFSQQRLWVLDQLEPGTAVYNDTVAYRLSGALDESALELALETVVRRHDSLRTVFVQDCGEPRQVVTEPRLWKLHVVDLSGQANVHERLEEAMHLDASRAFDLSRGPLFRAVLYRLGHQEHGLLLAMHHIVSDGWSLGVLGRELSELYSSYAEGTEPRLEALPVQYRDFARWQRERFKGEVLQGLLDHWRKRLAGAPQVLELPTDRPRPASESHRGALHRFTLPLELVERMRHFSQAQGVTLFMTLLTGYALLLSRYSGQEDVLIGSPVANRNRVEIEPLIGVFVNTLVLRADMSGDPYVEELLSRLRETCLDAYANQDLPFERLVKELQSERDLSRNPVFQAMFILQGTPADSMALDGLRVEPVEVGTGTAKVDLTLDVWESPEGLKATIEYATDLFDAATVSRLADHWRLLLEAMVADPAAKISQLPLLSEAERDQLLDDWNNTKRDYPAQTLIHELFEAQADRTPQAAAVVCGGDRLSYRELEAHANRLAHVLRRLGVGRGQRVGLCLERGVEMLAALLGILKAGAAYVPLDPSFPQERLRFMAKDAELALLVSNRTLAPLFELDPTQQVLLDADAKAIATAPAQRLEVDADRARAEEPAYVIYTSGSTGKPKGVVVPHRAVVNFLESMARAPGLGADDVLVAVTTLSFDIAVLELQLPLMLGATVVMATRDDAMDGHGLSLLLQQSGASVMQATPATWRLLIEAGWKPAIGFKALVGGEALPRDLAEQLLARGVELWNLYGPTETTVWSTCARIEDADAITIGEPIANTSIRILDAHHNLCPVGVPGELCIGGAGVSLGYWNRPELTAEKFVSDPFSDHPSAQLYCTGDRARWRTNGTLEHLGRFDDQIKLRGYRIELGEIEAVLSEHPGLRQAAVMVREDVPGDQRLVAYLVSESGSAELIDQLRKRVRARLPEYMMPSHFVSLEWLPLTPNGKVDRKALPSPYEETVVGRVYIEPQTATEVEMVEIWKRLLKVDRIGTSEDFFALGGHSLLAMQLIENVHRGFGVRLPLQSLFEAPTVTELALVLDAMLYREPGDSHIDVSEKREEFEL